MGPSSVFESEANSTASTASTTHSELVRLACTAPDAATQAAIIHSVQRKIHQRTARALLRFTQPVSTSHAEAWLKWFTWRSEDVESRQRFAFEFPDNPDHPDKSVAALIDALAAGGTPEQPSLKGPMEGPVHEVVIDSPTALPVVWPSEFIKRVATHSSVQDPIVFSDSGGKQRGGERHTSMQWLRLVDSIEGSGAVSVTPVMVERVLAFASNNPRALIVSGFKASPMLAHHIPFRLESQYSKLSRSGPLRSLRGMIKASLSDNDQRKEAIRLPTSKQIASGVVEDAAIRKLVVMGQDPDALRVQYGIVVFRGGGKPTSLVMYDPSEPQAPFLTVPQMPNNVQGPFSSVASGARECDDASAAVRLLSTHSSRHVEKVRTFKMLMPKYRLTYRARVEGQLTQLVSLLALDDPLQMHFFPHSVSKTEGVEVQSRLLSRDFSLEAFKQSVTPEYLELYTAHGCNVSECEP